MTDPYVQDADFTLYVGDALEVLQGLPSESVHMCVTSPPFFGLRDYGTGTWEGGEPDCDHKKAERRPGMTDGPAPGYREEFRTGSGSRDQGGSYFGVECGKCGARRVDRQIGLEASPDEWVARLVDVFREVRRVLRHDATLWLEIGDSYAANVRSGLGIQDNEGFAPNSWSGKRATQDGKHPFKQKDLVGTPWLLAFALRADGWYLRSDIIWARPNPMPESVRDRPTKSHSYVFLLSKSPRYFFDQEAVREPHTGHWQPEVRRRSSNMKGTGDPVLGRHRHGAEDIPINPAGRNLRSVWTIPTEPLPDEHYAAYPQKLVERCILAGTSERGCCPECGAPWERVVEREGSTWADRKAMGHPGRYGYSQAGTSSADAPLGRIITETMGWQPTCGHAHKLPDPAVVLDPFLGSGTTALVARRLGRHTIGIELSPTYAAMAARRLQQLSLLA